MDNHSTKTLYELLGKKVISQLVDAFYARVYRHPVLIPLFQNEIEEVKDKQFCFLSQFLGGPQLYNEKYGHPRMRMRHMPHRIDEKAMEAWLSCMKDAISTLDIEPKLAEALYNCFPPLARHMVNS
ncbi:MAG: globin [Brumimicrobium sp.]